MDKNGLDQYRKIYLFNETGTFIPLCILLISLFIFPILFSDQDMKDISIIIALSMIVICIPVYIICGYKIHKYNYFLKNSLIIDNISIEDVDFISGGGIFNLSCINVRYTYFAPNGVVYESNQKTKLFWNRIEPNQREKWREMLQNNNNICVLVSKDAFSKSYLPLCEEYCLRYNKMYVVHLVSFYEDVTI